MIRVSIKPGAVHCLLYNTMRDCILDKSSGLWTANMEGSPIHHMEEEPHHFHPHDEIGFC